MNSLQSAANHNDRYQDSHLMVDFQLQVVLLDGGICRKCAEYTLVW